MRASNGMIGESANQRNDLPDTFFSEIQSDEMEESRQAVRECSLTKLDESRQALRSREMQLDENASFVKLHLVRCISEESSVWCESSVW